MLLGVRCGSYISLRCPSVQEKVDTCFVNVHIRAESIKQLIDKGASWVKGSGEVPGAS